MFWFKKKKKKTDDINIVLNNPTFENKEHEKKVMCEIVKQVFLKDIRENGQIRQAIKGLN